MEISNKFFEVKRKHLVKMLIHKGVITSPDVERAMKTVPREMFLPENVKMSAYVDSPLPIGSGQTISAPHMVAMMAEALELQVGHKILEVGSGSGYHAAVLAEIVAPKNAEKKGYIFTIEVVPELSAFARRNLEVTGYNDRVTTILGDGSIGCPEFAPYDRILVTAAAPKIPKALIKELKIGGILVIPVGGAYFYQELIKARKESESKASTQNLCNVAFVPLTGKDGWRT